MTEQGTAVVHPRTLLTPRRLDLVCKYLYFRELSAAPGGATDDSPAAQLYRKHILRRTGGVEPPDPYIAGPAAPLKQSVADYMSAARALLDSLVARGFDPACAVPYFANGTLGNGAHRVAAALALDMPVAATRLEGKGDAWDFRWFVEHGFDTSELQRLLAAYVRLKAGEVAVFVFYGPAREFWDVFGAIVGESLHLVGHVDLEFDTPLALYELVHDLYGSLVPLGSTDVINRKALLLAMARPLSMRVVVAQRRDPHDDVHAAATELKARCRAAARERVPPSSYLAIHASASREEDLNMAGVLLSPNSWRQLSRRRTAGARPELLAWLHACRDACQRAHIPLDDICIVGSTPLEITGIRPSTDVDFTMRSAHRRRWGGGVTHLAPGVDIVTEGYHRTSAGTRVPDDDLVQSDEHHFRYRGFKCANPEIVLDQKAFYRRDKDVRDVELAARLLDAPRESPFDPAFEFAVTMETMIRRLSDHAGPLGPRGTGVWRRWARRLRASGGRR